jgi:3-oxoacyl-[acyl-carrier protein] reductase
MAPVPHLNRSLVGRRALVTGAASGMGRAIAHVLAREGARVGVLDIDAAGADAVAGEIVAEGGQARAWPLDVADALSVARKVPAAIEALGGLDILINNAGVGGFCRIDQDDYETIWARLVGVLLSAHQRTVRAALPALRRSDAARILNIASTEALGATAANSAYAAAKAGVAGLTRALAVELGPEAITVNCICPGPILTGMTQAIPEDQRAQFARRRTALRRYGEPVEVAHMVLSFCLPAASYLTGAVVPVDGGLTARNA